MVLVAVSMIAILGIAALSIDAVTLYLAREEAQRTADTAALAAARVLSISGITGDPQNATSSWSAACTTATEIATVIAQQNTIAGQALPPAQITVTFPNNPGCGSAPVFGVNPEVTVRVQRTNLPSFFARIWGRSSNSVSASATAEAYNSSNSGAFAANGMIPIQPRCVKPWLIPNRDPTGAGGVFVDPSTGDINKKGVLQLGGGVIGESFTITSACKPGAADCTIATGNLVDNPPNSTGGNIDYVPADIQASPYTAVPTTTSTCPNTNDFQKAIDGCDQQTQYQCGVPNGANIDLADWAPVTPTVLTGDTGTAVQCLIHSSTGGQDVLRLTSGPSAVFPFQIQAGLDNPIVKLGTGVNNDDIITSSSSIVNIPIYDSAAASTFATDHQQVTILGFLQVFINRLDVAGNPNVTVLNVSGCSNNAPGASVSGTSPVPVRLITPP